MRFVGVLSLLVAPLARPYDFVDSVTDDGRVKEYSGVSMRKVLASMIQVRQLHDKLRARVQTPNRPPPRRDMAFVSVFSFDKDPQRGKVLARDKEEYVQSWKQSVERLGMPGTILHDKVYSPEFVAKENGTVRYVHMNPAHQGLYSDPDLVELTPSDWRFIALHDYLRTHEGEFEYVILTDGSDVEFRSDPMMYMRKVDEALGHKYVYGQEEWRPWVDMKNAHKGKEPLTAFSRLVPYWKSCFQTTMPELYDAGRMPNCGILGGHVSVVMPFLERMRHWYAKVPQQRRFLMCDMLVYMRTIMEDYQDRFVSGYPFHAKFKDRDPRDVAAIYHKHPLPPAVNSTGMPEWRSTELRVELQMDPQALTEELPSWSGPFKYELPGNFNPAPWRPEADAG